LEKFFEEFHEDRITESKKLYGGQTDLKLLPLFIITLQRLPCLL